MTGSASERRNVVDILDEFQGPLAGRILRGHRLPASEISPKTEDLFPTGNPDWDHLLRGGLRRGTLTEIVGRRSCGRFAFALALLATVTEPGETAVLVDLGDHLDPRQAIAAGIDLQRLLWLRPQGTRESLAAAETALDGGFPLVLVELGLPPLRGGRGKESAWMRLARSAAERRTALVVSSPYRVSGTAAHTVLQLRRMGRSWLGHGRSPRLLGNLALRLELAKGRGRRPGDSTDFALFPEGPREPARTSKRSLPVKTEIATRAICG